MVEKLRKEEFRDLFLVKYCEVDDIRENEMSRGDMWHRHIQSFVSKT